MTDRVRRGRAAGPTGLVGLVACLFVLVACGSPGTDPAGRADPAPAAPEPSRSSPGAPDAPVADPDRAVDPPPKLSDPLLPADLLVYGQEQLSDDMLARIDRLDGVVAVEPMAMAQVSLENRVISIAAVDPASYRRFTPPNTAQNEEVWARVAGGEMAIPPRLGKALQRDDAFIRLGNDKDAPEVHIGAYADQAPQIDAVVNRRWGEDLGMIDGNALLLSTGINSPQSVQGKLQRIVGTDVSVQILGPDLDITATQTAFLTGGSVAEAVGSFSYRVLGGGRIAPDPAWVSANIRTEEVPILGTVTCHRVMLPQLRGAFTEIASRGLADEINPDEYAGCYYPRFIAGSTQLSLHSFGIAVDLNVPGNQRGTVGEMDREVVAIFKKWGFGWGGDWSYTDPMHFEMNAVAEAR